MTDKILNPETGKLIDAYGRTARAIYREAIESGIEPSFVLPPLLTYQNGRFRKKKPVVDFTNVSRITYDQVADQENQLQFLRQVFAQYAGKTIQIAVKYTLTEANGEAIIVEKDETIEVPPIKKGFSKWWRAFTKPGGSIIVIDSDTWIFSEEINEWDDPKLKAQLVIMTADKVGQSNYQQYFLDGVTHCVLHPIYEWAEECLDEAKSKSAVGRYKKILKDISNFEIEYAKGVGEKDLPVICNKLQIGIDIDLPSTIDNDTVFIECVSQKKPLKKFKFINTRLNHIELNEVSNKSNYEEVSGEELRSIYDEKRDKGEFILWNKGKNGLTKINTLNKIYKLSEDEGYYKEVKDFEDYNNLRDYKIEYFSNKTLSEFLYRGLNINSTVILKDDFGRHNYIFDNYFQQDSEDKESYFNTMMKDYEYEKKQYQKNLQFLKEKDEKDHYWIKNRIIENKEKFKVFEYIKNFHNKKINHIDLQKAYTRGSECSYYQGYLAKITDFRQTDEIVGVGMYMIKKIKCNNPLFNRMKLLHEYNIYPSPELEFYRDNGVEFQIVMGAWGSTTDIDFGNDWTKGMFLKEDKVSHYCKWYGCLMKLSTKERYQFACKDLEFAKLNNQNQYDVDIRFNEYNEEGIIEYKKKEMLS